MPLEKTAGSGGLIRLDFHASINPAMAALLRTGLIPPLVKSCAIQYKQFR
jgi:hypothetical protein